MKEYLIESKIKNNLLYQAIMTKHDSIATFCRANDIQPTTISQYLNLKNCILTKKGEIKDTVIKICGALNKTPEELFPPRQWEGVLKTNKIHKEVDEADILSLETGSFEHKTYQLEDISSIKEQKKKLQEVIPLALSTREERVINLKYGLNGCNEHTHREIGELMGVSGQAINVMEKKAIRKLQHPKNGLNIII